MTPDEKELSRFVSKTNLSQDQKTNAIAVDIAVVNLVKIILEWVPSCADRTSALRYLRLASMQAKAAICHDWPDEPSSNP